MVEKQVGVVVVINILKMKRVIILFSIFLSVISSNAQDNIYKKRVLESIEIDMISSLYNQFGDSAAVCGGLGTEELQDATATIIISAPLNDDGILKFEAGVSSYTSASSSNINPFSKKKIASPFNASSGASKEDEWTSYSLSYLHYTDDRNRIVNTKISVADEYDYSSFGFRLGYTSIFNRKNTELSINSNVYFDEWKLIYPIELRNNNSGDKNDDDDDDDDDDFDISLYTVTGAVYSPEKYFSPLTDRKRNSYSLSLGLSQILSKNLQTSFSLDVVKQQGLLSTPFHRIYFNDVDNSFIENFQLANDIERLPSDRYKISIGNRLSLYINEVVKLKSFYRFYTDDWGISSNTISIEAPCKVSSKFTIYPAYRFYNQTASIYFDSFDEHFSTDMYYTSDNDLSGYTANQYSFGLSYTDIFSELNFWRISLKTIDLKYAHYSRSSTFRANILTMGIKFIID
jgi:hypothetical protein